MRSYVFTGDIAPSCRLNCVYAGQRLCRRPRGLWFDPSIAHPTFAQFRGHITKINNRPVQDRCNIERFSWSCCGISADQDHDQLLRRQPAQGRPLLHAGRPCNRRRYCTRRRQLLNRFPTCSGP